MDDVELASELVDHLTDHVEEPCEGCPVCEIIMRHVEAWGAREYFRTHHPVMQNRERK